MKKYFNRIAKQGAVVLLGAALVFNASYFSAPVFSAGSELNAAAAGTDETAGTGEFTVTDGTLDTDYTYADGALTVTGEAALPSAETMETTETAAVPAEGAEMVGVMTLAATDTQTENSVASVTIGDAVTYYDDLVEAWNAAQGNTAVIELLNDVNLTDCLEFVSGDITYRGGDHTLTSNNEGVFKIAAKGTFSIESGKIVAGYRASGIYVVNSESVVNISGDNTYISAESYYALSLENGKINISGGHFYATNYVCLGGGDWNGINIKLSGGEFTGDNGSIEIQRGDLSDLLVEGYQYYVNGKLQKFTGKKIGNHSVSVIRHEHNYTKYEPNPDGGTHIASCEECGESFKEDHKPDENGLCDCGYTVEFVAKVGDTAYWNIYTAFAEAISQNGTITLLKDGVDLSRGGINIRNGMITLNLNGKCLKGGGDAITVDLDSTLVIEDNPEEPSGTPGKIEVSGDYAVYLRYGTLVINSGTFIGNKGGLHTLGASAKLTINGGVFTGTTDSADGSVNISCVGTDSNKPASFIYGGRFEAGGLRYSPDYVRYKLKIYGGEFSKINSGPVSLSTLLGDNCGYYYLSDSSRVTDADILSGKEIANVKVISPPVRIISHAVNQQMNYGGTPAKLHVTVSVTEGFEPTFQWYDVTDRSADPVPIEGATGSEFTLSPWTEPGAYWYSCTVQAGTYSEESEIISVLVNKSGSVITAAADMAEYEYNGVIKISASAAPLGDETAASTLSVRSTAATAGQMAIYYNKTQICEPVNAETTPDADGRLCYTMRASALDIINAGAETDKDIALTVKFIGSSGMENAETTVTVKIKPCQHTSHSNYVCDICGITLKASVSAGGDTLYVASIAEAWEKAHNTGDTPARITLLADDAVTGTLTVGETDNIVLSMSEGVKLSKTATAEDSAEMISVSGKFIFESGTLEYPGEYPDNISVMMNNGVVSDIIGEGTAFKNGEDTYFSRGDILDSVIEGTVKVVKAPFVITEHPKNIEIYYMADDEEAPVVSVRTSEYDGELVCLWFYDEREGVPILLGNGFDADYMNYGRIKEGSYPLYCVIEDLVTGCAVRSKTATLTVLPCPHEKIEAFRCLQCGARGLARVTTGDNTSYYFDDIDKAFMEVMGKTAVLDLNTNHTIDGALEITSGTSLTLGAINPNNLTVKGGVTVNKGGSLVITGGVVSETNGVTVNGGSFTLDGGSIWSDGIPLDIISGRVTLKFGSLSRPDKGTVIKIYPDASGNYPYTVDDILSEEVAYGALDYSDGVWYWADTSGSPYEIAAKYLDIWPIPVEITSQPEDTSVVYGNTPTLAIAAQDTDIMEDFPVTYQWYEVADDNTETILTGETNPELSPAGLKPGIWRYCCYAVCKDYNLRSDTAAVTVTPAPLTITGAKIAEKVYDKTTAAAVTDVTFGGLVGNDSLKIDTDYTAKAVFDSAEAGGGRSVTVTVTLSRGGSYVLTDSAFIIKNAVIEKAPQTLTISKDAYTAVYKGDEFALKCKTNGDGKITYSVSGSKNALGEKVKDNEVITVSENGTVSITGAGTAAVIVTLGEGKNYTGTDSKTISVLIEQLENVPNMPGNVINAAKSCDTLSKVKLPDGWKWIEDMALEVDIPVTSRAVYVNADKNNYKNISVTITVTRSNCEHEKTSVKNAVKPGCVTMGYTGDTYCEICGVMTMSGTETPPAGHKGGIAGCVSKAVCGVCGEEYGDTDPDNHIHTETRNEKAATCTESGYSGEVVCTDCNALIQPGNATEALGHDYRSEITTKPTTGSEGVMTYTCSHCGDKYTESIPKLDKPGSSGPSGYVRPGRPSRPDRDDTPDDPKPDNTPSNPKPGNTGKPYIKGDNGKEGWDVIRAEIDITKDGGGITVEMNGTTEVPGDILNSIKGKDVTLTLDMGDGISWSVNGKDITAAAGNIDFGVTVGSSGIPVDVINNVTGESYSVQLSLSYDGEFGFKAVLSIELGTESAGCYASLFYYNAQSGEPEFISESKITEDGIANLEFTHASDYIIVVNEKSRFDEDGTGESSGTSDTSDTSETPDSSEPSGSSTESGGSEPTSDAGDDSSESSTSSGERDPVEENPKTGAEIPFIAVLIAAAGVVTAYLMSRRKKDGRR